MAVQYNEPRKLLIDGKTKKSVPAQMARVSGFRDCKAQS